MTRTDEQLHARALAAAHVAERLDVLSACPSQGETSEQRALQAQAIVDATLAIYQGVLRSYVAQREAERRQFQHALNAAADPKAVWPPAIIGRIAPDAPYGESRR